MPIIDGTNKSDIIVGGDDSDWIYGYDGYDTLHGRDGNDMLVGMGGNDTLYGGNGRDRLFGWEGDDRLDGGPNADELDGGAGLDFAVYDTSTHGVSVNLAAGVGFGGLAQGDTLANIEGVIGSDHADQIYGDAGSNYLYGYRGSDIMSGGDGIDFLYGDGGSNPSWGGDDTLKGGGGDDFLMGMAGDDDLYGGAGRDVLFGDDSTSPGVAGADTFVWGSVAHTGATRDTADTIYDFDAAEGDLIHLSGIDADTDVAGNQAFSFIGGNAFSGTPGEIRYYVTYYNNDLSTFIELHTDASPGADAVIRLYGYHEVQADWFVL
jgi:Ca2+-binding RTX toxin-like protein